MANEITVMERIENKIFTIRGQKVMLDRDLAELYGVELKRLNEAVKRNIKRFPVNFMFQLSEGEWNNLRSQIATAKSNISKVRYLPYAFTEHGVTMLASVLNSDRAIEISIKVVETFIALRQYALNYKDLKDEISELKKYFIQYANDNNEEIERINQAINLLMDRTKPTKIGFTKSE